MTNNFISVQQFVFGLDSPAPVRSIINSITIACKIISEYVKGANLSDYLNHTGNHNMSGDSVIKLDTMAQSIIEQYMEMDGNCCIIASEDSDSFIRISGCHGGKYVLLIDPLDGSSNTEVSVSVGTIFNILEAKNGGDIADCLQAGIEIIAAGYVLYGSSTILVVATQSGVNGFTLDPKSHEFLLTRRDIKVPEDGKIFSINSGAYKSWELGVREYINEIQSSGLYKLRYVATMVADVHRTLLKGGIFMHPLNADTRKAKLRLLYEANPMAFVMERAGGMALANDARILEIEPTNLHQKVPVIMGSTNEVKRFREIYIRNKSLSG